MRRWKAIFAVLTLFFAAAGLLKLMPYYSSMPIMFVFFGLSMLANAKECYDKGDKGAAVVFFGIAVLLYAVTAYNLISRIW